MFSLPSFTLLNVLHTYYYRNYLFFFFLVCFPYWKFHEHMNCEYFTVSFSNTTGLKQNLLHSEHSIIISLNKGELTLLNMGSTFKIPFTCHVSCVFLIYLMSLLKKKKILHLAGPGLSCSTQDLQPSLQHAGSFELWHVNS